MSGGAHVGPVDDAATQVARQAKQEVAIVEALQITAIGKAEDLQRPVFTAGVGRGGGTARPCAEQERDKQDGRDDAAYDRKQWRHEGSTQLTLDVIPGRRGPRAAPPTCPPGGYRAGSGRA